MGSETVRYAIKVRSKEYRCQDGSVLTKAGKWFWVTVEPDGWVEATSSPCDYAPDEMPKDVKTFETHKAAADFAQRWKGHPYWTQPDGTFAILEVKPRMVQDGWELT